jgi:putative transposase
MLDIYSSKVLSFRLSNTLTTDFCIEALEEALHRYGKPEIVNSDQGSRYTSAAWIALLDTCSILVSMDGKRRWVDNVFIERFWRSVEYEEVFLRSYRDGIEARRWLAKYIETYNHRRLHEALGYRTPEEVFRGLVVPTLRRAA